MVSYVAVVVVVVSSGHEGGEERASGAAGVGGTSVCLVPDCVVEARFGDG
jgi:hypothetical protein